MKFVWTTGFAYIKLERVRKWAIVTELLYKTNKSIVYFFWFYFKQYRFLYHFYTMTVDITHVKRFTSKYGLKVWLIVNGHKRDTDIFLISYCISIHITQTDFYGYIIESQMSQYNVAKILSIFARPALSKDTTDIPRNFCPLPTTNRFL